MDCRLFASYDDVVSSDCDCWIDAVVHPLSIMSDMMLQVSRREVFFIMIDNNKNKNVLNYNVLYKRTIDGKRCEKIIFISCGFTRVNVWLILWLLYQWVKNINTIKNFPTKTFASKMSECCCVYILLISEIKLGNNTCWWEIKIIAYRIDDDLIIYFACVKCLDKKTQWFCNTDSVTELYLTTITNSWCYNILC